MGSQTSNCVPRAASEPEHDPGREIRARAWRYVFDCYEIALIEGSTVVLEGKAHRASHSAAGDFARWGRQGGLTTLNLYGRDWFTLLARRRWEKISAVQLTEAFSALTIRAWL